MCAEFQSPAIVELCNRRICDPGKLESCSSVAVSFVLLLAVLDCRFLFPAHCGITWEAPGGNVPRGLRALGILLQGHFLLKSVQNLNISTSKQSSCKCCVMEIDYLQGLGMFSLPQLRTMMIIW
jgi:hypothetical protein